MKEDSAATFDPLLAAALFVGGLVLICYAAWHRWRMRGRPAKRWKDAMAIGASEFLMLGVGGFLVLPFLALLARLAGLR